MADSWDPHDPAVYWQWGCAGRTRGVHHHDERCAKPPIVLLFEFMAGKAMTTHG